MAPVHYRRVPRSLNVGFFTQRLAVWRDSQLDETVRFRKLYGDEYLACAIGWLGQAKYELT
ncbi:hypothetical protein [Cernens ardua]|uniref:hypothetical protein n=1 Tax=Cernens ardua TaxID=3402176 RepID=UPI003F9D234D